MYGDSSWITLAESLKKRERERGEREREKKERRQK
jgi:hypothetical protein